MGIEKMKIINIVFGVQLNFQKIFRHVNKLQIDKFESADYWQNKKHPRDWVISRWVKCRLNHEDSTSDPNTHIRAECGGTAL